MNNQNNLIGLINEMEMSFDIFTAHKNLENKYSIYRVFREDIKQRYDLEKGDFNIMYRALRESKTNESRFIVN